MLLSNQTDFDYDNPTSSSNPPGPPPTGDGGSGRGLFSGFSFLGGRVSGSDRDFDDRTSNPAGPRDGSSDRGDRHRGLFNGQFGFGGRGSASGRDFDDRTSNPAGHRDGISDRGDRHRGLFNGQFGFGGRDSASGRDFDDRTSNPAGHRDGSSDGGNRYRELFNGPFGFGGGSGNGRDRDFDDRISNHAGRRDGISDRGDRYREVFNGQFGFGGGRSSDGTRGSSRNDNSRFPRGRDGRFMDTMSPSHHLSRDDLRDIAVSTLQALDEGEYFPPGAVDPYDLRTKIEWTDDNTRYYGPDAGEDGEILESEFIRINEEGGNEGKDEKEEEGDKMSVGEQDKNASSLDGTKQGEDGSDNVATAASEAENKQVDDNSNPKAQAQAEVPIPPNPTADSIICIGEYSTLFGARRVHFALAPDPSPNKKIGVLNFASAKKPGGGFINGSQAQEESIARTSTLYPSLITPAALPFYTHHREDPSNAYYTHAMVYSPGVVLLRDDNGEWRSPVKVDVLTSAAVNAGEIRRGLEKEERLRKEREELEIWRRRGEERRKEREKAMAEKEKIMAEKESLRKEKEIFKREQEKLKKEQEKFKKEKAEAAKLKKEKAGSTKLRKGTAKSGDGNGTEKAKETYSGSEKEETSSEDQKEKEREIEQEKENENEKAESEKAESEKAESEKAENENEEKEKKKEKETATDTPEETATDTPEEKVTDTPEETATDNPEEKATVNPESGSGPDGEVKTAEENTESKGASIQDVQPQSEATPEVSKEPTSSTTILHPLSQTQLSQAPKPDPEISYIHRLENAEYQIQHTMYTRISRILHLFQLHQTPYLILGSFGTGVFQNNTDIVANIFAELLVKPGGRFKNVFKTVVFAILGKETVRVFEKVFSKVEKLGKRTRGGSCVLMDEDGSDRDVKEGSEERMMRMMRWEGRRTALAEAAQAEADAASFAAIQADIAQAEIEAASWAAIQAEIDAAAAVDADPTAPDDDRIAEDEKMILTEDGEVDFAVRETVNATTTPKVMITEDGKDAEMEEIKSLSASNCEAKLNQKGDDDVEMQ